MMTMRRLMQKWSKILMPYVYSRPYVYSFWQFFQALHLFRTLEYITEPLNHDQIISNNLNEKMNPFCYRAYTIAFGRWAGAHGNGGIFGRQVQGLSLWQNKRWQHFDAHSCPERTSRYCNGPFQKGKVIYLKYYYKDWLILWHLKLIVDV